MYTYPAGSPFFLYSYRRGYSYWRRLPVGMAEKWNILVNNLTYTLIPRAQRIQLLASVTSRYGWGVKIYYLVNNLILNTLTLILWVCYSFSTPPAQKAYVTSRYDWGVKIYYLVNNLTCTIIPRVRNSSSTPPAQEASMTSRNVWGVKIYLWI